MKSAIVFYGQLRTSKKIIDLLYENLISVNDCDVFFHFWEYKKDKLYIEDENILKDIDDLAIKAGQESIFSEIPSSQCINGHRSGLTYKQHDENLKEYFIDKLNPKKYLFEEQKIFSLPENINSHDKLYFQRTSSMNYSILKSLELIDGEYDMVFVTRPNVIFNKKLEINIQIKENEIFAKGNKKYFIDYNLFSKLETLKKIYSNANIMGLIKCPEKEYSKVCRDNKIEVKNYNIQKFLRGFRYGVVYPWQFKEYNVL